jgi:putative transcriptional regulator
MSEPKHHIPEPLLSAYAIGSIEAPFATAIACHISICDECRAMLQTHQSLGGILLEDLPETPVSAAAEFAMMAQLDLPSPQIAPLVRQGIYPAPLQQYLTLRGPKWRALGGGVKQAILSAGSEGSLRILRIPAGQAVPEHGHGGLEMTLVLQGGFSDATGRYGVGDLEVTNEDIDHIPTAWPGEDCICLAATNAPLRFHGLIPRLLQPLFRI